MTHDWFNSQRPLFTDLVIDGGHPILQIISPIFIFHFNKFGHWSDLVLTIIIESICHNSSSTHTTVSYHQEEVFFLFTGKCMIFFILYIFTCLFCINNFLGSHHIRDNLLIKIFRLNTEKHNLWQLLISFSRFLFIIKSFFHLWAQTVSINCAPPPASSSNTNYCWGD